MPGTTPVYGFPYPEPTDLVADYPALGQQLAEDIEAVLPDLGGLAPVAPTSIANSGGSASTTGNTTTFTGVSSISLNGVFSADYDNYRIMLNWTQTGAGNFNLRFRASGSDITSSVYGWAMNTATGTTSTGSVGGAGSNGLEAGIRIGYAPSTTNNSASIDIHAPFLARPKILFGQTVTTNSTTETFSQLLGAKSTTATAVDGFTLYNVTFTGTVSVYGYRK